MPRIPLELLQWLDRKFPAITTSQIINCRPEDLGKLQGVAARRQMYEVLEFHHRKNNTDGKSLRKPVSAPTSAGGDPGADSTEGGEGTAEVVNVGGRRRGRKPKPGIDP